MLGYSVTGDLLPYWKDVQAVQNEVFDIGSYDKVVACDQSLQWSVKFEPCLSVDDYTFARSRNVLMEYAATHGYDGLVLLDADAILIEQPVFPEIGFSCCKIFYATKQEIHNRTFYFNDFSRWKPSSYFILNRPEFTRFKFHEDFRGYGFEDLDFFYNILMRHGAEIVPWTTRAIHHWHERRKADPVATERNRMIYESRRLTFTNN